MPDFNNLSHSTVNKKTPSNFMQRAAKISAAVPLCRDPPGRPTELQRYESRLPEGVFFWGKITEFSVNPAQREQWAARAEDGLIGECPHWVSSPVFSAFPECFSSHLGISIFLLFSFVVFIFMTLLCVHSFLFSCCLSVSSQLFHSSA